MWGVNIWVKLQEAPVTDLKISPLFFWTKWNLIKKFGIWDLIWTVGDCRIYCIKKMGSTVLEHGYYLRVSLIKLNLV